MEDKPWSDVFQWLARETGVPVITDFKVSGHFTFIGPKGARYTIAEIIGLINEGLLQHQLVLVRRPRTFGLAFVDAELLAGIRE